MSNKNVIIILMYNDSESTLSLLNNIQNYMSLEKIIVVDNCSTNDSYEKVKARENDHIHVIKTHANEGIAKGNNFGARYAEKICPEVENLLFSNPDVIVNEESIVAMAEFINNNPLIGAVCPLELTKERQIGKDVAWRFPTYWQLILNTSPIYYNIAQKSSKPYLFLYDVNEIVRQDVFVAEVIISCFIMTSRKAYDKVEGFNEDNFLYHEEDMYAYRLKKAGYKLAVLPKYNVVHLGSVSMEKTGNNNWRRKNRLMFDSSCIYMKECLHISSIGIFLYRLMYEIGIFQQGLYRKLRGKDRW